MHCKSVAFVCLFACLQLAGCDWFAKPDAVTLSGQTMGTTYTVVVAGLESEPDVERLRGEIEATLADVNSKMSNWDASSEISRFNASAEIAPMKISADLATVMEAAVEVNRKSNGKFDVTLAPLIELWGFGPHKPDDPIPSDETISDALGRVGQERLLFLDTRGSLLEKARGDVEINLSALAKGFGIDMMAERLLALGFENHLVDIGGDLRSTGKNERGEAWRIGIERPEAGARNIKRIVSLDNMSMATSGDYRNFIEKDGVRYSHIIDPSTGRPISHWTTSVSVIADDAMMADAWATALLVLGSKDGVRIANDNGIAAYFISRDRDLDGEKYVVTSSEAFEQLTRTP
ncbi:MAG: FAD:protein FMN transferase [Pseudomonadota bacterium]